MMQDTALHTSPPGSSAGSVPFYQSAYRYRQPEFLVGSVLLLGVFLPAFVNFAWQCTGAGRPLDEALLLMVPAVIFAAFAVIGGIMLYRFLTHWAKPLVIDESGVRYGGKHFAWADIRSLSGERIGKGRSNTLQLVLRERHRLLSTQTLSTTPGLTPDEHDRLMERLQREISPAHPHLKFTGPDGPPTPVMKAVFGFFMVLAGCGLALSVVVHGLALAGVSLLGGNLFWLLHAGVFLVWGAAMIASMQMTRGVTRKDFWKVALADCPVWMRRGCFVLFCYAILNFAVCLIVASLDESEPRGNGGGYVDPDAMRLFSGHWMVFYAAAFAVLCSRVRARSTKPQEDGK